MKKVYIIDDDRDIVDSISIILKKSGYEVGYQYNEKDVEKNISAFNPDLIILDVMFPEDSSAGFNIARAIKSNTNLTKIPIIMLSAINERGIYVGKFTNRDIDDSFLPVNMFLDKPVDPKTFIEKVKSVIG